MKISELTSKNYIDGAGAPEKSYVLINYEDDSTVEPITYKTSIDALGKQIAKNLGLARIEPADSANTEYLVKTFKAANGIYASTQAGILAGSAFIEGSLGSYLQGHHYMSIDDVTSGRGIALIDSQDCTIGQYVHENYSPVGYFLSSGGIDDVNIHITVNSDTYPMLTYSRDAAGKPVIGTVNYMGNFQPLDLFSSLASYTST